MQVSRLRGESIRLIPVQQAVATAQRAIRQYVPKGVSLVDEMIKERREEGKKETYK